MLNLQQMGEIRDLLPEELLSNHVLTDTNESILNRTEALVEALSNHLEKLYAEKKQEIEAYEALEHKFYNWFGVELQRDDTISMFDGIYPSKQAFATSHYDGMWRGSNHYKGLRNHIDWNSVSIVLFPFTFNLEENYINYYIDYTFTSGECAVFKLTKEVVKKYS